MGIRCAVGDVVLSSDRDGRALSPANGSFSRSDEAFETTISGIDLRALTVPIDASGSAMFLQVARSERIGGLRLPSVGFPLARAAGFMLGSLLVFSMAVFYTLRRTLHPIRDASLAASRIEPRSLSTRLAAKKLPTELVPLIDAFNLALDRLERGYKIQQELLEAVAHELKTPLSLIRGQIEMEDRPDRASLLVDVDFMARQVHQLLHLAEVSGPQNYIFESVDVVRVVQEAVEYMNRLADRHSITLEVCSVPERIVVADHSAIFILFKNLIENAIQHSPPGGTVSISVDIHAAMVRDRGTGIASEDFPHLFKRFWRGPKSQGQGDGAGLGLAICNEIALAHGWRLSAKNVTPGAAFEVAFDD